MPGSFSGLTPMIITMSSSLKDPVNGDKYVICKFPNTSTVTDLFLISQTGATTQNTTTNVLIRILNGGTTGNVTTRINSKGGAGNGAFTQMVARNMVTNFTMNAGQWLVLRYSETGTNAWGIWNCTVWAVEGNV